MREIMIDRGGRSKIVQEGGLSHEKVGMVEKSRKFRSCRDANCVY